MKTSEEHKHPRHTLRRSKIKSLEDVKMQLVVNQMRIKIEQQRLITSVTPGATPMECAVASNISRIETIMQYATLAVSIYRMTRRGIDIVKSLRSSK